MSHIHIHIHDDFEESKHPRGQPGNAGQFKSSGRKAKSNLGRLTTSSPAPPGTSPIPKNTVRRFHATGSKNVENIRKEGLRLSANPGGNNKVFSFNNYEDAARYAGAEGTVIEFYHDANQYKNDVGKWNSSKHGTSNVPPENILNIYPPWYQLYHTAKLRGITPDKLRKVGLPEYDRAAKELEKHKS